jgi:hypothetical protein
MLKWELKLFQTNDDCPCGQALNKAFASLSPLTAKDKGRVAAVTNYAENVFIAFLFEIRRYNLA